MSIEIVGSNDNKIKLITDNNIESIIKNQEIAYNLYKNKYLNLCNNKSINNQKENEHLIKQFINTFYVYNNTLSFNDNLTNFINYLNTFNNKMTMIEYMNNFLIINNIFINLESAIKKILFKILKKKYNNQIKSMELNNNYYIDILYTLSIIKEYSNNNTNIRNNIEKYSNIHKLINNINKNLLSLENLIEQNKIISLKNLNSNSFITNSNNIDCTLVNNIINKLNIIIINNTFIKTNILKIDSIINIITEILYKLYLII